MKHTLWELKQKQSMPLKAKIIMTEQRIKSWYNHFNGNVYISFSGGKDSTVLLNIARNIYPNIKAMYVDTGLEYPEIRDFVETFDNVDILHPKKSFYQIIKEYGYPIISKEVAHKIEYLRKGSKWALKYVDDKKKSQYNIKKWKFLLNAPFKISNRCCDVMKKSPAHKYAKETGLMPITAQMASESKLRTQKWIQNGCNAFDSKNPISNPMSFWTENDVLQYIYENNIQICSVYGNIEKVSSNIFEEIDSEKVNNYRCSGVTRTGCMFCMFGVHLEKSPNRFERMKITHPKIYDYCINKLELGKVLDYINVKY